MLFRCFYDFICLIFSILFYLHCLHFFHLFHIISSFHMFVFVFPSALFQFLHPGQRISMTWTRFLLHRRWLIPVFLEAWQSHLSLRLWRSHAFTFHTRVIIVSLSDCFCHWWAIGHGGPEFHPSPRIPSRKCGRNVVRLTVCHAPNLHESHSVTTMLWPRLGALASRVSA